VIHTHPLVEPRPVLAIVPARGGSRGVPRKNMRTLGGRPLIAYTLTSVTESGIADRLLVSSEDAEILRWARLHGYEIHERPAELATDDATISDLAIAITRELGWEGDVGVFQPTSPLLSPESMRDAVEAFQSADVESLASCVRERHLYWYCESDDLAEARPLFSERVNRQHSRRPILRETGGVQLVRAAALLAGGDIVTANHLAFEVSSAEGLDIDTAEDLIAARGHMARATVVIRLRANHRVGSGHLHHCLQLADELADHRLRFLLRDCDPFVAELLHRYGYEAREERDLADDLRQLAGPGRNLVINDVLDTEEDEILAERIAGFRVINVEDLGPGARFADWVVNALYPIRDGAPNASWGAAYATLRSEFLDLPAKPIRDQPERVLVTFGGTDPGGLGPRCARLLADSIEARIRVVTGFGASPEPYPSNAEVVSGEVSMAEEMMAADLAVTSAGRTVYEAAATGTPVVVLAANAREATHAHLGYASGVVFLGIGSLVDDQHIVQSVQRLLADPALRAELSRRLRASIDGRGAVRIAHRVRALLADL
jgi:CMP-N-acetylneuraminic acid synthetase/spore coat polysaccharide biosynthesis predicted glycosyltransferase SpsG